MALKRNIRIFINDTKVDQIYYDIQGNAIRLKPGMRFEEDLTGRVDVMTLIRKEEDRQRIEIDADEMKRSRKAMALARIAKTIEDLDKLEEGEKNQDVLDAILQKKKEFLNGSDPK